MARRMPRKTDRRVASASPHEWLAFAKTHTEKLLKELEHLIHEFLASLAEHPLLAHREQLIREAREQLHQLVSQVRQGPLGAQMEKVLAGDILGWLHIPTQKDLGQLKRKLQHLESRIDLLDRHQHPPAP